MRDFRVPLTNQIAFVRGQMNSVCQDRPLSEKVIPVVDICVALCLGEEFLDKRDLVRVLRDMGLDV
jgi:hypothetical protein